MASTTTSKRGASEPKLDVRVVLLCRSIRWIAVGWITWALISILARWTDTEALKRGWGHFLGLDLSALPSSHAALGFAIVMVDWAVAATVVVFVWRLFGHFLAGRIFSADAVLEMRRVGAAGVAAVAADVIARPLLHFVFSMHLGVSARASALGTWLQPNDALHLLMALAIVALGVVFKAGVDLADEHRQFV